MISSAACAACPAFGFSTKNIFASRPRCILKRTTRFELFGGWKKTWQRFVELWNRSRKQTKKKRKKKRKRSMRWVLRPAIIQPLRRTAHGPDNIECVIRSELHSSVHSFIQTVSHSVSHSLIDSVLHSLTHSLTHSLSQSFIQSVSHSLSQSLSVSHSVSHCQSVS